MHEIHRPFPKLVPDDQRLLQWLPQESLKGLFIKDHTLTQEERGVVRHEEPGVFTH